jgi:hypothetical protein
MRPRKIPFGKAIRVSWFDSLSLSGWQINKQPNPNTLNIGDVAHIRTIGYVAGCTPEAIAVTTSIGCEGEGSLGPVSIPWKSVAKLDFIGKEWDR